MELKDYIRVLWRRKWVILLTFIITTAVVSIGTFLSTPVYQATTVLRIAASSGGPLSYQEYVYTDQLMNTYIEMVTRRPVVKELTDRLQLDKAPQINAEIIPNTELIKITVEDTNAELAARAANTLADILIAQSNQLYIGGEKRLSDVLGEQLAQVQADLDETHILYEKLILQTPPAPEEIDTTNQALQLKQSNYATLLAQYQQALFREEIQDSMITVFETAVVPESPSKPRVMLNILFGLFVGLAGGLGLAFLFENLDSTLYTTEDIESAARLVALAKIPEARKEQMAIIQDAYSPISEAFRNLATSIQQVGHGRAVKGFLILSAEPNQGKSLIVSQLAFALAEAGRKVVAVDCDMRLPRLHCLFEISNQVGLSDVLEGRVSLEVALQESSSFGLHVLASGPVPSNPSKLLGSLEMEAVINSLWHKFDYVLLDTPAMLGIADVATIIEKVDGFLWVVRRGHARREAVDAARKILADFSGKSMGLVINQADLGGYYGYYRYRQKSEVSKPSTEKIVTERNFAY